MKSTVETLSPTRAKLTVEVPFEELKPSLDAAYQTIAKQINVPGFRKGKVPPAVIDRQVGRGPVLDQAINEALPQIYVAALQENDLAPLAQPEIEVTRLDDNELLEFVAEVDVRPTIELPDYEGLAVSVDDAVVTDSDVDDQVEGLRTRFATLIDVDREAAEGDVVTLDLKATLDGEDIEGGELTGYAYTLGSGEMLPGADEAVTGLKAGESATFTSQLLGGDLAGQDVDVAVTVTAVKERELPELDEEFAQTASEFDTIDELRADIASRLERGKRLEQAAAARDAVLEALLEKSEIPLPEAIIDAQILERKAEIEQQLQYAGLTMESYLDGEKQTIDEFEADLEKRVRDAMAAQFLLDEVVTKSEIGVEQDELTAHLMRRAQESGQDPQQFMQHMVEHNHIPDMIAEVVRGKALARIVESAAVTDASGNTVELKNLRPDGSIAEPADEVADVVEVEADAPAEEITEVEVEKAE